jgi:hypothetical protein
MRAPISTLGFCILAACGGPRRVPDDHDASAPLTPDAPASRDGGDRDVTPDADVAPDADATARRDVATDLRLDAAPMTDAPAPRDAASDTDASRGFDAADGSSPDAGDVVDVPLDDAPVEAGRDIGADAAPDAAADIGVDAAADVAADVRVDAAADVAPPDVAPDASPPTRCPAGMRPAGEACVPFLPLDAPRPIAPPAFHRVTSHRPTFEWELAPGAEGARVQVCADRACAREVTSFDVTGTSGRPTLALPRGVLWWRLYARAGGARGAVASEPWSVVVTARDVALDTFQTMGFDYNGDGFADGLYGDNVLYGGAGAPYRVQRLERVAEWGPPTPAHDLNGDGYADVILCRPYEAQCAVFRGGPGGLLWGGALTLPGGRVVVASGDDDHDGYADLMIFTSAPPAGGGVNFHRGGPFGVDATPWRSMRPRNQWGAVVGNVDSWEPLGDMNGDRLPDTALNTFAIWAQAQVVVAYGGGALQTHISAPDYGTLMGPAGDMNGDGSADLFTALRGRDGPTSGMAFLSVGVGGGSTAWVPPPAPYYESAFGVGDINGDGVDDYISFRRLVLSGRRSDAYPTAPEAPRQPRVGDLNGDGYDDLLTGGPSVSFGGPTGLGPPVLVTVRP